MSQLSRRYCAKDYGEAHFAVDYIKGITHDVLRARGAVCEQVAGGNVFQNGTKTIHKVWYCCEARVSIVHSDECFSSVQLHAVDQNVHACCNMVCTICSTGRHYKGHPYMVQHPRMLRLHDTVDCTTL
jgi:hypothetical protein